MNYYPFHIGDYASATRHLSWDEDLAYRRLLDWCYTNEKPLPLDVGKVCRLIVATSDAQRVAAETVLSEFFVSTSDGWIHERVTAELERMRERQEASEEREEHEKTRQQKHRERRAQMFAKLSEVGVYPAWNAKTGELERLIAEHCDAPVTDDSHSAVTAPVTAPETPATDLMSQHGQPATAIPIPTPTPTPRSIGGSADAEATPPKTVSLKSLIAEGIDRQKASDWLVLRKAKRLPLTITAWEDTKAEGRKVNLDPAQTVAYAVSSNWAGFKASWYTKDHAGTGGGRNAGGSDDWTRDVR